MNTGRGFTLIELITVIVILSIVAALGSGFVVTAVESYRDTQERAKLVQKGRLAIEQTTRRLRIALPYSVRVSASGNCIEYFPVMAGTRYLEPVADGGNGMAETTDIAVPPIDLTEPHPSFVAIGALSEADIYSTGSPSALARYGSGSGPILLAYPHRFVRNSINQRLYLTGSPERLCIIGRTLTHFKDYGLVADALGDEDPGGEAVVVAANIEAGDGGAFALSPASAERNAGILINLLFRQGSTAVELNHKVLIRNVP